MTRRRTRASTARQRIRTNQCRRKVRHATEGAAKAAAQRTRGKVEAYWCQWCKGWHVGHQVRTHL